MNKWRPIGFASPIGGITEQYSLSEKDIAQQAFDRIVTKAIADAPIASEQPELCAKSAHDLQQQLLTLADAAGRKSDLHALLIQLAHACKYFKAQAGKDGQRFHFPDGSIDFDSLGEALGVFRIAVISVY